MEIRNQAAKEAIEKRFAEYKASIITHDSEWIFNRAFAIAQVKAIYEFLVSESYEAEDQLEEFAKRGADFSLLIDELDDLWDEYDAPGLPSWDDLYELCNDCLARNY